MEVVPSREGLGISRGLFLRSRGGQNCYVVVIEFLSKPQPFIALRLALYVLLFYHALVKELGLERGDKLPAVFTVLLYNGEEDYDEEIDLVNLIETVSKDLLPYQPSMRHLLIKEREISREILEAAGKNALATLLRLQQSDPRETADLVLEEKALDWLEAEDDGLLRDLLAWVSRSHLPEKLPETPIPRFKSLDQLKDYMEEDMPTWSDMLKAEGRAEGQANMLISLTEEKFGTLDETLRKRIVSAPTEVLLTWAKRILTAPTLEDVFQAQGTPAHGA